MEIMLGVIAGIVVAYALFSFIAKWNYTKESPKSGWRHASQQILLPIEYDQAMRNAKDAVTLFKLNLQRYEPERGRLIALTGMDLRTVGEIVTITLKSESGGTHATIHSRPAIPFVLLDYGRNKANVDAIVQLLLN